VILMSSTHTVGAFWRYIILLAKIGEETLSSKYGGLGQLYALGFSSSSPKQEGWT
jgi:hypothetical protein